MNWVHLTCSECEMTFDQRHQLGNHMNSVHLHVKPYKPICKNNSKKFILDCEIEDKPESNKQNETYRTNFEPYEPDQSFNPEALCKTNDSFNIEQNEPLENELNKTYESSELELFEPDEPYEPGEPNEPYEPEDENDDSPYEPYEPYEKYEPYEPY